MKSTEQKIIKFIGQHQLISPGEKILIALSGGPDSVFALNFFYKFQRLYKVTLGAAHVNHSLRGKEADKDEKFSRKICEELKIDFYSVKVDVHTYAAGNKLSVEEAARELRYSSLNDVLKKYRYDKIVTAHTLDDNAETVLLNLFKGTGLRGISGIPVVRENIIRPFLVVTKEEILEYLNEIGAGYRTDRTNKDIQYKRNLIRHKIIPLIKKEINLSLEKTLFNSSQLFRNAQVILNNYINPVVNEVVAFSGEKLWIDLKLFSMYPKEMLGEILRQAITSNLDFEFEYDDYIKIESLIKNRVGKSVFLSSSLIAVRDREKIVIYKKPKSSAFRPIEVKIGDEKKIEGKILKMFLSGIEKVKFDKNNLHEFISADNLDNKFIVRRWKAGDRFIPLGMKDYKNISDFLTEQKLSYFKKKEQLLLINRNNIVWVVGLRIDDRYRINQNTKKVCEIWLK